MKTFTKHHSDYWKFWQTKAFSNQKENIKIDNKMIEGQITEKIYQGCATRYSDGKRKLIDFEKGERC